MAKRKINRSVMDALGGEETFDLAIERFKAAREAHKKTEGVPAPAGHPLIEDILDHYDGYQIEENTKPELKQTIEQKMIEDYTMLKEDMEVLKQQMIDMGVAVYESRQFAGFAHGEVIRLNEVITDLEARMTQVEADYPPIAE